jgi:DNA transformation protein
MPSPEPEERTDPRWQGEFGRFGGYGNLGDPGGRGDRAEWESMSPVATLEDSENIDPHLAADLRAVGIATIDDLRELGSIEACRRMEERGLHDCLSALMALEGAIVGVGWLTLEPEHRRRLRDEWYRHGS